ncbi:phosphopyruvate hydratase [Thermoproteota archaeon]
MSRVPFKIKKIIGREILDSRGNPTVEADVVLSGGTWARASVPSGVSAGIHEALELRDLGKRYNGRGVKKAVANISKIEKKLKGMVVTRQRDIDAAMIKLDRTKNKSKLGANAMLAVSLACARAAAMSQHQPLHAYLGKANKIPIPCSNVLEGGHHAGNALQVQEFMIAPVGLKSYKERLRAVSETYHALKGIILKKYGKDAVNVGDEGGFAPPIDTPEQALDLIEKAVKQAGYTGKIKSAMDIAASEFYTKNRKYRMIGSAEFSGEQMIDYYKHLLKSYKIILIEDPFDQDDYDNWTQMTRLLGKKVQIVGDDLLVTNKARIESAIQEKWCNSLLLKVNQIGTLTEAMDAADLAMKNGWKVMVSHRGGETNDSFIADLTVGLGAGQIKNGAPCRGERLAKHNQLLRIEEHLGKKAKY